MESINHQSIITNQFWRELVKKQEEIIEHSLRKFAEPPIKGRITKNKIKWRGIRLIRYSRGLKTYIWLEQRGKRISPSLELHAMLDGVSIDIE